MSVPEGDGDIIEHVRSVVEATVEGRVEVKTGEGVIALDISRERQSAWIAFEPYGGGTITQVSVGAAPFGAHLALVEEICLALEHEGFQYIDDLLAQAQALNQDR